MKRLTRTGLAIVAVAFVAGDTGPCRAEDSRELQVYAAAIRYAAHGAQCTAKNPCCFSIAGKAPDRELIRQLASPGLRPSTLQGCAEPTINAVRLPRLPESSYEAVQIDSGPGGGLVRIPNCTYYLRTTAQGWRVLPTKTVCPVT